MRSTPPPASRSIALVRHGETAWNAAGRYQGRVDLPLNERGREQAVAAGRALAEEGRWEAVVSSPLLRARETARAIADRVGLADVLVEDGLIERSFGDAEGMSMAEAHARWPQGDLPGAEPEAAVAARALVAWGRLALPGRRTIVVCHVAVIRALMRGIGAADPGHVGNGTVLRVPDLRSYAT